MKRGWILRAFIIGVITPNLFINTLVLAASEEYEVELEKYAKLTEIISGGFNSGNRVLIRVGDQTFFENIPHGPSTAGLYIVAIHNNGVLLKRHYNTYQMSWASEDMAEDIRDLPYGTFVAVAAKGEPTRYFDKRGQQALYQIGASTGLLSQKFRTSYLCIGVKGIARGKAIEQVGMDLLKYRGAEAEKHIALKFGPDKKSEISDKNILDPNDKYGAEFVQYTSCSEVVSSGPGQGDHLLVRIGNHTFYDNVLNCRAKAGLYVVAIYKDQVLLQRHYNTYSARGASLGMALDISKLPDGTFVVIAAHNEATRFLDKRGQNTILSIGAETGFLKIQGPSYLCLGMKGMDKGKAIEKLGIGESKYTGGEIEKPIAFTFPKKVEPEIKTAPGKHEGLMIGDTEAIYYIPKYFDPNTAKYLFGIHGAGAYHRPGALTRISQFRRIADIENLIVIAPVFDPIFNRPVNRAKDMANRKSFKDPCIIKDWYLWNFIALLNSHNEHRTDLKLIEIFDFFNRNLMKREKFYLDGHSGGGQFVARFVLFHPELIEKAAICSAGSFVFPRRDIDYPYGLKLDNLEENFGPQINAEDLKLTDSEIDQKLNQLLDLKIFIIAGEKETGQENRPERDWQGKSTLGKAQNFYKTMKEEDLRLKEKGLRSSSKPYPFELHIIPNVGHNSHATAGKAIELLFPVNEEPHLTYRDRNDPGLYVNATNMTSSPTETNSSSGRYLEVLKDYASRTKAISGGFIHGNQVLIRVDDYTFYSGIPHKNTTSGLYVVAIYNNEVLLQGHYNTYFTPRASKNLSHDIDKLPDGTFVVVAAKDEPTRLFEEEGQKALYQIGAGKGLLNQKFRTSYLCLGVKGLRRGQAIEEVGMKLLEHIGSDTDKPVKFTFPNKKEPKVRAGLFKIYDPSVGEKETWSINDHCFMRGKDGTWHMFGITGIPRSPISGKVFAHATAESLTQVPWDKKPFALKADSKSKEVLLWAPHIILHKGFYYMYYCAGDKDPTKYKIHLAISKDLEKWQRHPENPMIVDGFHARDPFVIKVGDEWVMYYTATSSPTGGNYVVACQASRDLIHWSNRKTVFRDPAKGTGGGPTESPFVVRRGEYYYLFIGPRGGYVGTDVFRSGNPFKWDLKNKVGHIKAHAAEVIRDVDGKWYVSHCGIGQGGVYLAPLYWNDGLDDSDTSLPIPK